MNVENWGFALQRFGLKGATRCYSQASFSNPQIILLAPAQLAWFIEETLMLFVLKIGDLLCGVSVLGNRMRPITKFNFKSPFEFACVRALGLIYCGNLIVLLVENWGFALWRFSFGE